LETLAFLFTDIEGSTLLLRRLGDRDYARLLDDHHRLVRESLLAHDGKEQGTQGDSFFATFTSPSHCVAAAVDIQRSFDKHDWLLDEAPRVRMGIHTGEASDASTGIVGYDVHRAARIAAVGHGGQVLLSAASAGLAEDSLPFDVALRNLGSHRLKDLGRPETIFQLVGEGLADNFGPLASLDNPELPNNLPASLNPFVGVRRVRKIRPSRSSGYQASGSRRPRDRPVVSLRPSLRRHGHRRLRSRRRSHRDPRNPPRDPNVARRRLLVTARDRPA
jgi:class 3 adenylate cyclase